MSNFIRDIHIETRSLDPASAEVWATIILDAAPPNVEIRGKLLGPHCPYASTVEVAYPLRPMRPDQQIEGATRLRAVIPEASLWDPQSPFLYTVVVELWHDGQRLGQHRLTHGLRGLLLSPKGLAVNGKLFRLNGRTITGTMQSDRETALRLRSAGVNLVVAPMDLPIWWQLADLYGFLVLGQVHTPTEIDGLRLGRLAQHPSCLAWLAPPALLADLHEASPDVWLACAWDGAQPAITPRIVVGPAAARAPQLPFLLAGSPATAPTDLGFVLLGDVSAPQT